MQAFQRKSGQVTLNMFFFLFIFNGMIKDQ